MAFPKMAHPVISIEYGSDNIAAAHWALKNVSLNGFARVLQTVSGHYIAAGY